MFGIVKIFFLLFYGTKINRFLQDCKRITCMNVIIETIPSLNDPALNRMRYQNVIGMD